MSSTPDTLLIDIVQGPNVKKTPRLRQNENGPCFVIALINAIFLQTVYDECLSLQMSDLVIKATNAFAEDLMQRASSTPPQRVPMEHIYSFLVECLMLLDESVPNNDVIETLPHLNNGLLINPSFDNILVEDFNIHTAAIGVLLSVFDLRVYHGFLMPSELLSDLSESDVKPNFDNCQDYLVSHIDDETKDPLALTIDLFLSNNSTELTDVGYQSLIDAQNIPDNAIFLFFRNDHYNTCLKHNDKIYLLVTDIGYATQPDIVWTELSIMDDGEYFNSSFGISTIRPLEKIKSPAQEQQETADMLLAKQIQIQEDERLTRSLQSRGQRSANQHNEVQKPKPKQRQEPKIKSKSKAKHKSQQCVIV